nr:MATE family efflux transporter [Clostridia bacterium]
MDSEVFEKLPPTKLFIKLCVPSMITMAFGALYQVADGFFVGRFVGQDALAAVNLIMPIIMMVFAFSNMVATGASVRVAVLLGEKNREEASRVFSFSLKFIFIMSCILGVLGVLFAEPFVRLLSPGATEEAIGYGVTYIRINAIFTPVMPIFFATDNFLRVCGKEDLSMWLNVASQTLNVVLDVILIAFFGMGIGAAAFTSCISVALGAVVTLWLFKNRRMDVYFTNENISLKRFTRILLNGSSEFFSNISMSVMSVVFNLFLLKYGGTVAVAAFSVVMYVDSIIGMLSFSMGEAMQPAISYCYGAGLHKRVKQLFTRVLVGAFSLSVIAMLFLYFAGQYVAPLFVKPEDSELLAVSIVAMKLFSFSYFMGWVDMCYSSYFTAVERPLRSLAISFVGTVVFPIAALYALCAVWELNGVWLSATVSCTATAAFTLILAATMKNKKA